GLGIEKQPPAGLPALGVLEHPGIVSGGFHLRLYRSLKSNPVSDEAFVADVEGAVRLYVLVGAERGNKVAAFLTERCCNMYDDLVRDADGLGGFGHTDGMAHQDALPCLAAEQNEEPLRNALVQFAEGRVAPQFRV